MATKRATGTGRSGKSMLNTANSKQTNPARLGGGGVRSLDSGGTVARYSGRGASRIPDAPGGATRTNAVGKVTRGGTRATTSLS